MSNVSMSQMLLNAVLSCDLNKIKLLLTDVKEINKVIFITGKFTLLHVASGIQNLEIGAIVSYLLNCGADPNASADEGLTPVHISAMWNNLFTLQKLLVFGGNPWLQDFERKDAFDLAVETNAYDCLRLLNAVKFSHSKNIVDFQQACKDISSYNELSTEYESCMQSIIKPVRSKNSNLTYVAVSNPPNNVTAIKDEDILSMKKSEAYDSFSYPIKKTTVCPQTSNHFSVRTKNPNFFKNVFFSDSDNDSDTFRSASSLKSLILNEILEKNSSNTSVERNNEASCCKYISHGRSSSDVSICSTVTSESSTVVEITHTDEKEGIVLVEQRYLATPIDFIAPDSNQFSSSNCSSKSDWKSYQTAYQVSSSDSSSIPDVSIKIPQTLLHLKNSEIFEKLKQLGDNPGPVVDTTRYVYLLRLAKLSAGLIPSSPQLRRKFSDEIYLFLDDKLDLIKTQQLEQKISKEFDELALNDQLRDGHQRRSFTYFLLDPRVTKNLPCRSAVLSLKEMFLIFIDSLFYVGKGTRGRPFCHLYEAAKAINDASNSQQNAKVMHILDIWQSGLGVVSLHCFQNCIPVEAFTKEACIIEAIGLSNLTNLKKGQYYGTVTKLTMSKKKQLGVLYLSRALEIFLLEGERLIRLKDVT